MGRRSLLCAGLAVLLVASTACEPQKAGLPTDGLKPAVPVAAPTTPATPGTWRAKAETWVQATLYPKVLNRTPTQTQVIGWGDGVVRHSPARIADIIAGSGEARGRAIALAYGRVLVRLPALAELTLWQQRLTSGWTVDQLVAFLANSGEFNNAHPSNTEWVQAIYLQLFGRPVDAGALAFFVGRLAGGETRTSVALSLQRSLEERRRIVGVHYQDVMGAPPSTVFRDFYVARLASIGGNEARLLADLSLLRAPKGLRVGVVGDSVSWDLAAHATERLPFVVGSTFLRNAAALGCGTFAAEPGYRYRYSDGTWYSPGDDWCVKNLPPREAAVMAQGVDVFVWPLGAWEQGDVLKPDLTILPARTTIMRDALIQEIVKRIDGYKAGGVKRVLFPEFACVRQVGTLGSVTYAQFLRGVIDGVIAQRPSLAAVAKTPPQVCQGGDPYGESTLDHALAREDDGVHWRKGAPGASWAWSVWLAPAIADLTGVVS